MINLFKYAKCYFTRLTLPHSEKPLLMRLFAVMKYIFQNKIHLMFSHLFLKEFVSVVSHDLRKGRLHMDLALSV
jgi:hypothetical protein